MLHKLNAFRGPPLLESGKQRDKRLPSRKARPSLSCAFDRGPRLLSVEQGSLFSCGFLLLCTFCGIPSFNCERDDLASCLVKALVFI